MVFELQERPTWCIISGIIGFFIFLGITFWLLLGFALPLGYSIMLSLIVAIIGGLGLSRQEGLIGGLIVGIIAATSFTILVVIFELNALGSIIISLLINIAVEILVGVVGGLISVVVRASSLKIHMRPH